MEIPANPSNPANPANQGPSDKSAAKKYAPESPAVQRARSKAAAEIREWRKAVTPENLERAKQAIAAHRQRHAADIETLQDRSIKVEPESQGAKRLSAVVHSGGFFPRAEETPAAPPPADTSAAPESDSAAD